MTHIIPIEDLLPDYMLQMEKHAMTYMDTIEHQMHVDQVVRRCFQSDTKVLRTFEIGRNQFRLLESVWS